MEGVVGERRRIPVAFLEVLVRTSEEEAFGDINEHIPIFPSDDFFFGRSPSCKFVCNDSFVSNKHLHIHCIIFEEDDAAGIPPLVYTEDLSTNGTYLTRAKSDQQLPIEQRISRRDGSVLLSHGDQLRISPHICLRFRSIIRPKKLHRLTENQSREAELFKDRYTITDRIVGSGGHGEVFVAIHKRSSRQMACKVVDIISPEKAARPNKSYTEMTRTRDGSPSRRAKEQNRRDGILNSAQFREIDVLKDLDHPNIVRLEKVFWSSKTIYIFQELITGGDLFSYIEHKGGKVSNTDAAVIIVQILKGVEYLHDLDIVHRDLKPDNILITSTAVGGRVVITDFGNSRQISGSQNGLNAVQVTKRRMFSIVGTLEYAAPEIHKQNPFLDKSQGYSKAIDMWSIGAITTALLAGDVIFTDRINPMMKHEPARVILSLSSKCNLSVIDDPNSVWRDVARRAKDFVKRLLVLDENQRLNVKQAMAHEWFKSKHYANELNNVYQRSIEDWSPRRKIFRLIEALEPCRLKHHLHQRDISHSRTSRFFAPLSVPFPQGELYPDTSPPTKVSRGMLPRIDEEITPDPETPTRAPPAIPLLPRTKKPGRFPSAAEVRHSLSQLDLDTNMDLDLNPSEPMSQNQMTPHEDMPQHPLAESNLNASAPIREPDTPLQAQSAYIAVAETPPDARKRPRSPSPREDDTYDDTSYPANHFYNEVVRTTDMKRARVC